MTVAPPIATALFAWLHLLTYGLAMGLLLSEYWLCRRNPDRQQVRLLGTVDLGYLLSLIASLATGLARVLFFGRDTAYYLANHLFWLKIALFAAILMMAVFANRQFIRWNQEARSAPAFAPLTRDVEQLRANLAMQLGLLLLLPLLAVLVARGYGLSAPQL